ncbi:3-methyl-2-oxobutanoate hydroxymethyltransferase [candidate division KSB1 bacterium]|nr:3-methyl-2-oxobutanoate hydroxymethyltransferase [candidate division KSB1 bacterium]
MKPVTIHTLASMKQKGEKISALTAYDALMAMLLDKAGIDFILVGDSCATVVQGESSTLPMTMSHTLYHTKIVRKGVQRALLVADMPFMSYQESLSKAIRNAGRLFQQAGVDAVKIEGGAEMAETIQKIARAGMPVMGHLGLTPQSVKQFGGYKLQAATRASADKLIKDARVVQDAGAFALVLEKIPQTLARQVTQALDIPTIGIGAGPHCDGQILVSHDILGLFQAFQPRFVRRYADLASEMSQAFTRYIKDVKDGNFPAPEESYDSEIE